MIPTTTDDLIRQIRNQIREQNKNSITDQEIMDTINRGQQRGVEVMTRNWIYNYVVTKEIQTDENGKITIPEGAKGNRLINVEANYSGNYARNKSLQKLNYKNVSQYNKSGNGYLLNGPSHYFVQGREATVYPQHSCKLTLYYVRNPESVVKPAGSIYEIVTRQEDITENVLLANTVVSITPTEIGASQFVYDVLSVSTEDIYFKGTLNASSVILKIGSSTTYQPFVSDPILFGSGPDLSVSNDGGKTFIPFTTGTLTNISQIYKVTGSETKLDYLAIADFDSSLVDVKDSFSKGSYFNVCDTQTGLVKMTLQADPISDKDGNTVLFKLYPMEPYKQTVLNRPITSPTSFDLEDLGIEDDDYVCSVYGSCVLELDTIMTNYVIQYSVCEIRRSMGNQDMVSERDVLKQFEQDVKRAYINRDSSRRIILKTSTFVKGRWRMNNFIR